MAATSLSFSSSLIFLNQKPNPFKLTTTTTPFKTLTKSNVHKTLSISSSQLATADPIPIPILSFSGDKIGETTISLKSAPPSTSRAVVHRGIITDLQNKRRGTASTLTRAEVRGGGKKPYPQKKTGRARRGSQRTPLRPGGGVVFGPKPRDWTIKINKKEKRLAMSTAIATAVENMVVVEDFGEEFEGKKPKTKEFIEALKRWGIDPSEKSMFLMMDVSENVRLSSRNIGTCKILTPRTLNLFDVLNSDKLVLTKDAVEFLNDRYGIDDDEDDFEEEGGEIVEDVEGSEVDESADATE